MIEHVIVNTVEQLAQAYCLTFVERMDINTQYGQIRDCYGERLCCLGQLMAAIEDGRWPVPEDNGKIN